MIIGEGGIRTENVGQALLDINIFVRRCLTYLLYSAVKKFEWGDITYEDAMSTINKLSTMKWPKNKTVADMNSLVAKYGYKIQ